MGVKFDILPKRNILVEGVWGQGAEEEEDIVTMTRGHNCAISFFMVCRLLSAEYYKSVKLKESDCAVYVAHLASWETL
jgi:hypothetical protein